ncbi:MAG: aldehyde dehydrogenase family protein, partial [Moraxellaceae bacterium]
VVNLLSGAMLELTIGNPLELSTDIGPVIDSVEQKKLLVYIETMRAKKALIAQTLLPENFNAGNLNTENSNAGYFVPPTLLKIKNISELTEEHFGPICHIISFDGKEIDRIIDDINRIGYGLTLGIHTRNEKLAEKITSMVNVGNIYINRNMIGAVVGVQPFGGSGLSGTGPKAGGPHYLLRFAREKTVSNYIAAVGGNIQLLTKQ